MRTSIRFAALAGSVLLWFGIPSLGQTNLMASFSKHAASIGSSESWRVNAFAAVILFNDPSKSNSKDTLFADGHFQNSNDNLNSHNDLWNSKDDHRKSNQGCQNGNDNSQGSDGCGKKWVSAAEGGASADYLLLVGIACCAAIYLKRKQWAGRDLA